MVDVTLSFIRGDHTKSTLSRENTHINIDWDHAQRADLLPGVTDEMRIVSAIAHEYAHAVIHSIMSEDEFSDYVRKLTAPNNPPARLDTHGWVDFEKIWIEERVVPEFVDFLIAPRRIVNGKIRSSHKMFYAKAADKPTEKLG